LFSFEIIFFLLVFFSGGFKLFEYWYSKKNLNFLVRHGGVLVNKNYHTHVIILHSFWFLTVLIFSFISSNSLNPLDFYPWLIVYVIGQMFKVLGMKGLQSRWTREILVLPSDKIIKKGVFKVTKHPYYFGEILEIISLPCIGSFYIVGIVFSLLNFVLVLLLIKNEELALYSFTNDLPENEIE
jgi:methyltransferase